MTGPGAPGWYPDPWGTPKQRWFDGVAWTPSVWPPDSPPEIVGDGQAAKAGLVDEERRLARLVAAAMPVAAAAYIATTIASVAVLRWIADNWDEFVDAAETGTTLDPAVDSWVRTLSWLGQFPLLAVQILFIVWCYKTTTVARELGIPARRSPVWAVGAWFIPVLNLWWPYQSVTDAVPHDDPARGDVRGWWALWIATNVSALLVFGSAFFSVAVTVAMAVVQSVLAIAAAIAARRMVVAVSRAHASV